MRERLAENNPSIIFSDLCKIRSRGVKQVEIPSWFQSAIQRRIDEVSAQFGQHPELRKFRQEENEAFHAVFPEIGKTKLHGFMEWEDKHHFTRALENERLYLQGMRDGAQLVFALLAAPVSVNNGVSAVLGDTETNQVKSERGDEERS